MARKSRKINFVNVGSEALAAHAQEAQDIKVSNAALYARLSFESDKNRERNTIETQMALLHSYVSDQKDIVVVNEYYDISKTGTNFEREGFDEMMQAIREGTVDCVIVKDLSRLGRNYVEAGSYIERVFPFLGVRFISVNDHYDSNRDEVDLLISMSNVYNEFYSKDLAKKVRSSYRSSWSKGEFPSGVMAYGYEKEAGNPHHLVPDPVVAPVVQRIFRDFLSGKKYAEIAKELNNEEYLCPGAYKRKKSGIELKEATEWRWSGGTIRRILKNQYYAGDSVHNQHTCDTWAVKKMIPNPKEQWIIVKDTHEPLVTREDFEKTQEMMESIRLRSKNPKSKGAYSTNDFNFFKSKIVCADCGKTMYLTGKRGNSRRFNCGNFILKHKCFTHVISDTDVNDYVLRVIRTHINVYVENVDMIRKLNERQENIRKYDIFNREIRKCRRDLENVAKLREQLFEDYACKLIDAEQYENFAQQYAEREKEIQYNMDAMLKQKVGYDKNFHTEEEWENLINKYRNTRTLTKGMVDAFVEKIEVSADKSIAVHLVYDDMLKELKIYAKQREAELCS